MGVSTGMISLKKYSRTQSTCSGVHCARLWKRMPWAASSGSTSSLSTSYCRATMAWARLDTSRSAALGVRPSGLRWWGLRRICSLSPPTRISKNSSMLLEVMLRKRSRSSSGVAGSSAWASTRRLNSRMPSSRLIRCSLGGRWLMGAFDSGTGFKMLT